MITHFVANEYSKTNFYLVDLPGYGFAKVSRSQKLEWGDTLSNYLLGRANLKTIMVLIDTSLPPQDIDMRFLLWLISEKKVFNIVFTKIDKLERVDKEKSISEFKEVLEQNISVNFGYRKVK